MLQKPDKDKKPFECPHCGSMNTERYDYNNMCIDAMNCINCDGIWFEYADKWASAFQKGKIIQEEVK